MGEISVNSGYLDLKAPTHKLKWQFRPPKMLALRGFRIHISKDSTKKRTVAEDCTQQQIVIKVFNPRKIHFKNKEPDVKH